MLYDELVDRSSVRKHEFEPEQRDEPRHGISKHGKRAPERLAFHTLLVEEQRKPQPEEVIDESGKHSPKDVPAEDLKETVRDVGKSDQFLEIVQPHPAHEFGRHGLAAVIREGDEDHEHYRQDIEHKHSDHGQEEHGLVKLLVQQPLRFVEELCGTLACRDVLLSAVAILDVRKIGADESDQHEPREDAHEEHDNGVVPFHTRPRITAHETECEEAVDRLPSPKCHEHYEQHFDAEIDQPFRPLLVHELSRPHEAHGRESVGVGGAEESTDALRRAADLCAQLIPHLPEEDGGAFACASGVNGFIFHCLSPLFRHCKVNIAE